MIGRTFLVATGISISTAALAAVNSALFLPVSLPTLGEIGLGTMIVILAAVGGYLVRRKK